ncbi:MAG: SH3 domain-containing protein [Leptospira sp.]|nr:SH3 domain-containing protein [Leptospira sp.]NCS92220.1 SH3 domain-containing protein [Leptospira sp.]
MKLPRIFNFLFLFISQITILLPMKHIFYSLIILFFLSTSFDQRILLAQGHWDGTIHIKKNQKSYAIFGENVNIRQEPNTTSKVVMKLQPGDLVKILNQDKNLVTIAEDTEYWYKIEINKKIGYVWGGLLADTFYWKNSYLILFRSLGTKSAMSEVRILKDNKILDSMKWQSGPIGLEDYNTQPKIDFLSTKLLTNPPEVFFKVEFFAYSEIEYGYTYQQFFTLSKKGKLNKEFGSNPASCDPPSCGEEFVLFPGDILESDPSKKRTSSYKANKNQILLIFHGFSSDEEDYHEWLEQIYNWNGKEFKLKE